MPNFRWLPIECFGALLVWGKIVNIAIIKNYDSNLYLQHKVHSFNEAELSVIQ